MSRPNFNPGIYDGLLFVSLTAVLTAILLLVMTLNHYNWSGP